MKERLIQWLTNNRLAFQFETEHLFSIGEKWFLLIEGKTEIVEGEEQTIIVNENFHLQFGEEDIERFNAINGPIDYYVFEFGTRFYYCDDSEGGKVKLNELHYIGREKTEYFIPLPLLGIHGGYDLCNGSRDYKDWCTKAKWCGVDTLGIAEENTLAGTLEFQNTCEKNGIKSIIGETVTVRTEEGLETIKLYVENQEGWKNLLMINSYINVFNEERVVTFEQLKKHTEGLICVITPEVKTFERRSVYMIAFGGNCRYQVDVSKWDSPQKDEEWLKSIQDYISVDYRNRYYSYPLPVLISDAYYLEQSDSFIKKELNQIGGVHFKNQSSDQYFKTPSEIIDQLLELVPDKNREFVEEATYYTKKFSEINFKIETGTLHLPKYTLTEEQQEQYKDADDLLWSLIEDGMMKKVIGKELKKSEDEYVDRIKKEMDVICEAKLQDYFLITWDILNWAHDNDIMTGFGRGSAAGCLVAYLLGIVNTDPLEYDLLFERFLNKARLYKTKNEECVVVETEVGEKVFRLTDDVEVLRNGQKMKIKAVSLQETDMLYGN